MDQTWLITAARGLVTITDGYPEPLALYNGGSVTLMLTQDLTGTAQGVPLPPGGAIVWDPGRPLGVFVATGQTTLYVLANSSPILNVAEALIDLLGLPALIAANIKIQGAPPINSFTSVFAGTCTDAGTTLGPVDVSQFQSLDVIMFENNVGGFATPLPRGVVLLWDNGLEDIFNLTDGNGVISLPGVVMHVAVPVRSPNVTFSVLPNGRAGTITFAVRGSYRTQPALTYQLQSAYWGKSGLAVSGSAAEAWQGISGVKGATTLNDYPSVTAGGVTMTANATGVAGNPLVISVLDLGSNIVLAQTIFPIAAASATAEQAFQAGNRPLQLQIGPPSSSATLVRVSLASNDG